MSDNKCKVDGCDGAITNTGENICTDHWMELHNERAMKNREPTGAK